MQYMYLRNNGGCAASRSRCPANNGTCGQDLWILEIKDAGVVESLYCKQHSCRRVDDGSLCGKPKGREGKYCLYHIQCAGSVGQERCPNHVQDYNASRYKYCKEYHACVEPRCQNARVCQGEQDLRYCHAHRCQTEGCANRHGTAHTCVVVPEAAQDHPRDAACHHIQCPGKRRCSVDECARPCRPLQDGGLAEYCAMHCCQVGCCDERTAAGGFCAVHVCGEPGCDGGRRGEGVFCERHAWRPGGCDGRRGGEHVFCQKYTCREDVLPSRCCDSRGGCSDDPGCLRGRDARNGVSGQNCGERLGRGTAGVQEPGAAAGLGTRCCASHLCHSWSCADSRERLYDYCA